MVGFLVREVADVADGGRQQTHVCFGGASCRRCWSRVRIAEKALAGARTRLAVQWSELGAEPMVTKYRLAGTGLYERTCRPSIRPTWERFAAAHFHPPWKGRTRSRLGTTCQRRGSILDVFVRRGIPRCPFDCWTQPVVSDSRCSSRTSRSHSVDPSPVERRSSNRLEPIGTDFLRTADYRRILPAHRLLPLAPSSFGYLALRGRKTETRENPV